MIQVRWTIVQTNLFVDAITRKVMVTYKKAPALATQLRTVK